VTDVDLVDYDVPEILAIVHSLRTHGIDFTFMYHPPKWDDFTGVDRRRTVFSFKDPSVASWFVLKYKQ
jgi:hypothetical protein